MSLRYTATIILLISHCHTHIIDCHTILHNISSSILSLLIILDTLSSHCINIAIGHYWYTLILISLIFSHIVFTCHAMPLLIDTAIDCQISPLLHIIDYCMMSLLHWWLIGFLPLIATCLRMLIFSRLFLSFTLLMLSPHIRHFLH